MVISFVEQVRGNDSKKGLTIIRNKIFPILLWELRFHVRDDRLSTAIVSKKRKVDFGKGTD